MKGYLQHRSRRWGYDGWAAQVRGEVVYVGLSRDVDSRLYSHRCERLYRRGTKRWDEIRVLHCDDRGLEDAELLHIRHYRPMFNVKGLE